MILTTIENVIFLYISAFLLSEGTSISHYDASCLFTSMSVLMFVRWFFIIHWVLPTHFHKANGFEGAIDSILLGKRISERTRRKNLLGKGEESRRSKRGTKSDASESTGQSFLGIVDGCFTTDESRSKHRQSSIVRTDIEIGNVIVNGDDKGQR